MFLGVAIGKYFKLLQDLKWKFWIENTLLALALILIHFPSSNWMFKSLHIIHIYLQSVLEGDNLGKMINVVGEGA